MMTNDSLPVVAVAVNPCLATDPSVLNLSFMNDPEEKIIPVSDRRQYFPVKFH